MLSYRSSVAILCASACIGMSTPTFAQSVLSAEGSAALADPDGRLQIGRGIDYVPSATPADVLFDRLKNSMKERRDFAWDVVEQLLQPQKITLLDGVTEVDVPLWQTWYEGRPSNDSGNRELDSLMELYFANLKPVLDADPNADLQPVIDATIAEFSTKDLSSSLTDDTLTSPLHQHSGFSEAGPLVGQGATMFSPSFMEHAMLEARGINECEIDVAKADDDPPSPDQFSPCMLEFPRSAVMIKTAWLPLSGGIPSHSTDATTMTTVINEGTWPGPGHPTKNPPMVNPDRSQIYTSISTSGTEFALTGIHFVTKDVREWVWISLWWDPDATTDFGADRPASIDQFNGGVWSNYKMCVNTAFDEGDATPWASYTGSQASLGDSLEAVHRAIENHLANGADLAAGQPVGTAIVPQALGQRFLNGEAGFVSGWAPPHNQVTSWCSNPNVETHPANARTSCIGCHQIAFTENEARSQVFGGPVTASFFHAMFGDYPQFGRARVRKNFPAEFSWSFGFEFRPAIASAMQTAGFTWPAN